MIEGNKYLFTRNGGLLLPPPCALLFNEAEPDIDAVDTTQKYDIDTAYMYGDEIWRYSKTGGTISSPDMGVKNGLFQGVAYASVYAAAAIGAVEVTVSIAATDGKAGTGAIAANDFAGGSIVFYTASASTRQKRRIVSNTACAAGGSVQVTFTIDRPLTIALTTSDHAEAQQNMFSYIVQDTAIGHVCLGAVSLAAASGVYMWVQRRGPTWLSPQSGVGVAGAQAVYWRHDGSLDVRGNIGTYVSDMIAGYVMAESSTYTQAAPFVFLTME